jgi:hypothetical protein
LVAEKIDISIRDTNIIQTDNYKKWNWDLILALLKVRIFYLEDEEKIFVLDEIGFSKTSKSNTRRFLSTVSLTLIIELLGFIFVI